MLDGIYYSIIVFRGARPVLVDFPAPADGNTGNVTDFASFTEAAALHTLNVVVTRRIDFLYSHSHFDQVGSATVTENALRKRFSAHSLPNLGVERLDAAIFIPVTLANYPQSNGWPH